MTVKITTPLSSHRVQGTIQIFHFLLPHIQHHDFHLDYLSLNPTYIAYEPPEFIGRSDISVATAKQGIIASAFELSKWAGVPLVVGAGVHSREDVRKCLELGAVGVAVAKDILMAQDPEAEVLDLAEGFK